MEGRMSYRKAFSIDFSNFVVHFICQIWLGREELPPLVESRRQQRLLEMKLSPTRIVEMKWDNLLVPLGGMGGGQRNGRRSSGQAMLEKVRKWLKIASNFNFLEFSHFANHQGPIRSAHKFI